MGWTFLLTLHCFMIIARLCNAEIRHLWSVSIDESPAPPSHEGPPFSAHASRDRSLLPGQVCGIVGAYIGISLILGTLILTVGRRLRLSAQGSQHSLETEMVKPTSNTFGISPVSLKGSERSWYTRHSPKKKGSKRGNTASPGPDSIVSFDPNVIAADKAAGQQELERLYAAALAQEAAKSRSIITTETELPSPTTKWTPAKPKQPLRLVTTAPALSHLRSDPASASPRSPNRPRTPKSPIRAIYPPDSPMPPFTTSPVSLIRADYPRTPLTTGHPMTSSRQPSSPTSPVFAMFRPVSPDSRSSTARRGLRKSLRVMNLRINAATLNYPDASTDDETRTPLSPRYFVCSEAASSQAGSEAATSPGTQDEYPCDFEMMNQVRDMPRAAPQRPTGVNYPEDFQTSADQHHIEGASASTYETTSSVRPTNNILPLRAAQNASASTIGASPFREFTARPPAPSSASAAQTLSMTSPSFTRVTYLERRRDMFGPSRTGMATPYSPYMPFTPLTPVTPHLTSRAERRQREREEGRRVLGEEDRVVEEDEMWGSGY